MANTIKIKRGSGNDPAASDMVLGEPVLRTDTAELFFKKDDGSVAKVSGGGGGPDFKYLELRNAANNGAASYPANDFTLVTSGTTNAITPAAANTLLVSVNGVIQKPNAGTSTSGITGFIVDGSRFKTATNLTQAPDFILYQESGGIGEPSDNTVSEEKLKVSNSPVNGYFLSAQSGNTGGLTWAAPVATSCTGNSATATALATARTINGTSFDGTANITVTAAAGTLSGNTLNSSVTASSLTSLGDLSGLTVTGNMAVDTSTLFVNASTNRVGIGTTSPNAELDIATSVEDSTGTLAAHGIRLSHVGATDEEVIPITAGFKTQVDRARAGIGFISKISGSSEGYAGDIGFYTRNSADGNGLLRSDERMRIDSNGRVGIGTSSPALPLHIAASVPAIRLADTDGNAPYSNISAGGGDLVFEADQGNEEANTLMLFRVDDSERMRIDSSGNVGINEISPDRKLHVKSGSNTNDGAFRIESSSGNIMDMGTDGTGHFLNCVNADPFRVKFAGTEKARFLAGGGITFNGDTAAANALDDYEEGAWTPTARNQGSFTNATGRYVKIGQQVTVWGFIPTVTNITSNDLLQCSGLPFTVISSGHSEYVGTLMIRFVTSISGVNGVSFNVYTNTGRDFVEFYACRDDGNNYEAIKHSDFHFNNSNGIRFCLTYVT